MSHGHLRPVCNSRASATRYCIPPDSCAGNEKAKSPRPASLRGSKARFLSAFVGVLCYSVGSRTFSNAVRHSSSVDLPQAHGPTSDMKEPRWMSKVALFNAMTVPSANVFPTYMREHAGIDDCVGTRFGKCLHRRFRNYVSHFS